MPRHFTPPRSNSDPNPQFRPQVDSLITKLRKFSFLQQHPEAVEFIIGDLMYHYFYREAQRPRELFTLMIRAEALWRMTMHLSPGEETEEMLRQAWEQNSPAITSPEAPDEACIGDPSHQYHSHDDDCVEPARCPMKSSITFKQCLLNEGHGPHSPERFHFFGYKTKVDKNG